MTVSERRERLMRTGACFWCLQFRHRAAACPANRPRCERCSGPHHLLMCERAAPRAVSTARAEETTPYQPSDATVISASVHETSTSSSGTILMQTAQVYATGESGQERAPIMLDSGSDRSFISAAMADQLQCRQVAIDNVNVQSFGGGQMKTKMS